MDSNNFRLPNSAPKYVRININPNKNQVSRFVDSAFQTVASGSYEWESKLKNGYWTYFLEEIWKGLRLSYRAIAADVYQHYGGVLEISWLDWV